MKKVLVLLLVLATFTFANANVKNTSPPTCNDSADMVKSVVRDTQKNDQHLNQATMERHSVVNLNVTDSTFVKLEKVYSVSNLHSQKILNAPNYVNGIVPVDKSVSLQSASTFNQNTFITSLKGVKTTETHSQNVAILPEGKVSFSNKNEISWYKRGAITLSKWPSNFFNQK